MDNSKKWAFRPPKICQKDVQMFTKQKPYTGSRVNSTSLIMPIVYPDIKRTRGLSALNTPLPKSWSWRARGTNKIEKGGLRDQGKCGGSWAFSLASALGDRYAIQYNIASPYPSTAWILTNATNLHDACSYKGNVYSCAKWAEKNSIKLEQCWPYSIISDNHYIAPEPLNRLPKECCFNCCGEDVNIRSSIVLHCKPNSTRYIVDLANVNDIDNMDTITDFEIDVESTITAIQREIMMNGPVVSTFKVYKDFMTYWKNDAPDEKIYMRKSDISDGGHAVVLTGWGEEKGIKFWEVRNSWGMGGDEGYCKIAFSTSTPQNKWIQIDIPLFNGETWEGGVITFLPGSLNNKKYFRPGIMFNKVESELSSDLTTVEGDEKKMQGQDIKEYEETESADSTKTIIFYVGVGIVSLIILFILYKVIRNMSKGDGTTTAKTSSAHTKLQQHASSNLNNIPVDFRNNYITSNIIPIISPY